MGAAPKIQEPESCHEGSDRLERALTLPLLVFYGLGVTVGAGIFALIGEIVAVSGGLAPGAFLAAALMVGATAITYSSFVRQFPRAGGEAVYVTAGLGPRLGVVTGMLVILAGTVSSAVIALAFGGYLSEVLPVEPRWGAIAVIAITALIACRGIRESVMIASCVTLIEVGTLIVVVVLGAPEIVAVDFATFTEAAEGTRIGAVASGAILAFFAFIGFEGIANLAEETENPERNAPLAIAWTLGISVALYLSVSAIAVTIADRVGLTESGAPMAFLFEAVSGIDGQSIAVIATLAMTNGILIQMVMAARVCYGMSSERLLPAWMSILSSTHPVRKTPVAATLAVAVFVGLLVMTAPLAMLARATSVVILAIFALVNAAMLSLPSTAKGVGRQSRLVAALGCFTTAGLACWELVRLITNG